MLDYQEMALQAVQARDRGRPIDFGEITYELETALGVEEATQLIDDAERDLASCNEATTTISIGE